MIEALIINNLNLNDADFDALIEQNIKDTDGILVN